VSQQAAYDRNDETASSRVHRSKLSHCRTSRWTRSFAVGRALSMVALQFAFLLDVSYRVVAVVTDAAGNEDRDERSVDGGG
jgi:hypothetical protein